jgi:hypothetical protein
LVHACIQRDDKRILIVLKIYEHRRGEYTTWYNTETGELSEDAYIEGVVNYMPESSKKFVATQVISDEEPYRMDLTGDYIKVKFFIEKKIYNRLYNFVIKVRERLRVYRK